MRDEENIQAISRDYYAELPEKTLLGAPKSNFDVESWCIKCRENDRSLVVKSAIARCEKLKCCMIICWIYSIKISISQRRTDYTKRCGGHGGRC